MSIIDQLASSLGRKDEIPNQELAEKIVQTKDKEAVKELIALLSSKNKDVQSDAIKVLYETGGKAPVLISPYYQEFITLLTSKNNRLVWGAMTALNSIAETIPGEIYNNITAILDAADKGSVIAKDHAVGILIKLVAKGKFASDATILLLDILKKSLPNQLPMYAENAMPFISAEHKLEFGRILNSRLDDMEKESKRKRLEKVIKKIG